jgi:uncharacterized protein
MEDLSNYVQKVWDITEDLYARQAWRAIFLRREVTFHGWPHVSFVAKNAHKFAAELEADIPTAEIAALVHDVNYLVAARGGASVGSQLRAKVLRDASLDSYSISVIEDVVVTAETRTRGRDLSREAMALSDADTLFKALPVTPVILSPLYMRETGRSVRELAEKIVSEQVPLREDEIYFYSQSAKKKYERWADANLTLWACILESLDDPSVIELIDEMEEYTKIPAEAGEKKRGIPGLIANLKNHTRNDQQD